MKSIFVLSYGWLDMSELIHETHQSIDSAEKSGRAFLATEKRFAQMGASAPAYYRIDRYNFDITVSEEAN